MMRCDSRSPGFADPVLFEMLKELRKKVAKEKNLPPFVISWKNLPGRYGHPNILTLPYRTGKDQGVSKGKASVMVKQFVRVSKYVQENDIVKPTIL